MTVRATPTPGWHASRQDLSDYDTGVIDDAAADGLELHLLHCERCRLTMAEMTASDRAARRDGNWSSIAATIDRPSRWNRSAPWIRLAVGTPTLLFTALLLAAVLIAVPMTVALGDSHAVTWFLAVAPAIPVTGTLIAYRASADPVGGLAAATPLHTFRIVVIRATVVLAALLPAGLVTTLLLPVPAHLLLGWLLPALGVCAIVLAVGTRHDPRFVAIALVGLWAAAVLGSLGRLRHLPLTAALQQTAVNGPVVQVSAMLVTIAAIVFITLHRDDLARRSA